MKNVGKVINLFVSVQGSSTRVEKESVNLDPKGIVEDKYYDTNINDLCLSLLKQVIL